MAEFTSRLSPDLQAKPIIPVVKDNSGVISAVAQGVQNTMNTFTASTKYKEEKQLEGIQDTIASASLQQKFQAQDALDAAVDTQQAADAGQVDGTASRINLEATVQRVVRENPGMEAEIFDYLRTSGINDQVFARLNAAQAAAASRAETALEAEQAAAAQGYRILGSGATYEAAVAAGNRITQEQEALDVNRRKWEALDATEEAQGRVDERKRKILYTETFGAVSDQFATESQEFLASENFAIIAQFNPAVATAEESAVFSTAVQGALLQNANRRRYVRNLEAQRRLGSEHVTNLIASIDADDKFLNDILTGEGSALSVLQNMQAARDADVKLDILENHRAAVMLNELGVDITAITDGEVRGTLPPGTTQNVYGPLLNAVATEAQRANTQEYAEGGRRPETTEEVIASRSDFMALSDTSPEQTYARASRYLETKADQFEGALGQVGQGAATSFLNDLDHPSVQAIIAKGEPLEYRGSLLAPQDWVTAVSRDAFLAIVRNSGGASQDIGYDAISGKFVYNLSERYRTAAPSRGLPSYFGGVQPGDTYARISATEQAFLDRVNASFEYQSNQLVVRGVTTSLDDAKKILSGTIDPGLLQNSSQPQEVAVRLTALNRESTLMSSPDSPRGLRMLEVRNRIDPVEGRGDYNMTFDNQHAADPESPMYGVRVSEMSIGEFRAKHQEYGQYMQSKGEAFATPVGRYQIVGETLFELADQMGLPDSTVLTPDVQDLMYERLYERAENVAMSTDKTLDQALADIWRGLS